MCNEPVHHVANRIILKLIRRQMWPSIAMLKQEWCWPLILLCHSCLSYHHYTPAGQFRHTHKHSQPHCQVKRVQHMNPLLPKRHVTAAAAQSNWLSLQKHLPLRWYSVWKSTFARNTRIAPHRLNQIESVSVCFFSTLIEKFNFWALNSLPS